MKRRRGAVPIEASRARKRLLFLCQMFPLPAASGTQVRVLNLLERLSRRSRESVRNAKRHRAVRQKY